MKANKGMVARGGKLKLIKSRKHWWQFWRPVDIFSVKVLPGSPPPTIRPMTKKEQKELYDRLIHPTRGKS